MYLNVFSKHSRHLTICNLSKMITGLTKSVNPSNSYQHLSFPLNSWLSWRTMLTLLMLRKRESREKLKEKERMMDIWSLMMPNSLSQVQSLSLFLFPYLSILFFLLHSPFHLLFPSCWLKDCTQIFKDLKSQHPPVNVGLPSRVVATVMVLCRDNGCSFLFLLPVSCPCFLCPILWAGSWPLLSPLPPQCAWLCEKAPLLSHQWLPRTQEVGLLNKPIASQGCPSPGTAIVFSHNRPDTKWQQTNTAWKMEHCAFVSVPPLNPQYVHCVLQATGLLLKMFPHSFKRLYQVKYVQLRDELIKHHR